MPREYIPNSWPHGRPAWDRTKALLRDYDRLIRIRQDLLKGHQRTLDGQPKNTNLGRPTESKGICLARINDDLGSVDQSAAEIILHFNGRVNQGFDAVRAFWSYDYFNYQHIRKDINDYGPSIRTWNRYKVAFMLLIAQKARII